MDHVFTGDRNFYDRYYFNAHTLDGRVFLVVAMGLYPNVGVIDAFATVAIDGKTQYIVRASRELGSDRMNTKVGPIGIEVIEGLRKLRVYTEPNEHGLSFDMTFEGTTPSFEEPHFFKRNGNRVMMDYTRLTQTGRWTGKLNVAGTTYDVDPVNWWGGRDRSWGIRPVGGGEPPSAPPPGNPPGGFFWLWSPIQFPEAGIMYTCSEETDGRRWHSAAELVHAYAKNQQAESLAVVAHDLKMISGSRRFDGGTLRLVRHDGAPVTVTVVPKTTLYMAGAGYAYLGGWRHGQYHGPLVVEGETWDLTDEQLLPRISGQTETVCDYIVEGLGDIGTGHGIFEFLVLGAYEPYGFKTFGDVAK
jgi:hypothetical protein